MKAVQITIGTVVGGLIMTVIYHGVVLGEFSKVL